MWRVWVIILLYLAFSIGWEFTPGENGRSALKIYSNALFPAMLGFYGEGLQELMLAESYMPKNYEIMRMIAEIDARAGRCDDALMYTQKMLSLCNDGVCQNTAAEVFAQCGMCDQARSTLMKSAKSGDVCPKTFLVTAYCYTKKNRNDKAVEILKYGKSVFPGNSEILSFLGKTLISMGKKSEGIDLIKLAIECDETPGYNYLTTLADAYSSLGIADSELIAIGMYVRVFPKSSRIFEMYLLRLAEMKKIEELKQAINLYLRFNDINTSVMNSVALTLNRAGETELALELTKRTAKIDNTGSSWLVMAECYRSLFCPESVLYACQNRLRMKQDGAAWLTLAYAYSELGYRESLLVAVFNAIEIEPKNSEILLDAVRLLFYNKMYDLAGILAEEHTRKFGFSDGRGAFWLANARELAGFRSECVSALRFCLKSDTSALVLNFLGYILADEGIRLGEVRSLLARALKQMPDDPAIIDSWGWYLFRRGRSREALEWVRKAYSQYDRDPEVRLHLGDIYFSLGDVDSALFYWRKSWELDPDNPVIKRKILEVQKSGGEKN